MRMYFVQAFVRHAVGISCLCALLALATLALSDRLHTSGQVAYTSVVNSPLTYGTHVYEVNLLDLPTGRRHPLFTYHNHYPDMLRWSPNGQQFIIEKRNHERERHVEVVNLNGESLVNLDTHLNMQHIFQAQWSPDGSQIAFLSSYYYSIDIYTITPDGDQLQMRTDRQHRDLYPQWSPDGSQIVFASNRDGNYDLYTLAVSCLAADCLAEPQRLTDTDDLHHVLPQWSPDGRYVAFLFGRFEQTNTIGIIDLATGTQLEIPGPVPHEIRTPLVWSPDSAQIVFASDPHRAQDWGKPADIYLLDVASQSLRQLTHNPATDTQPVWSPDGAQIAFTRYTNRDRDAAIYRLDPATGHERRIASGVYPVWR